MARINIEDGLWSDPKGRFLKFCIAVGSEPTAIGWVVIAWRLAQSYWCPEKRPIPAADWKKAGLPQALIDCDLATETPEGIYVRGSEEQFAWWFQRKNAGQKGGRPKATETGRFTEETETNRVEPSSLFPLSSKEQEYMPVSGNPDSESENQEDPPQGLGQTELPLPTEPPLVEGPPGPPDPVAAVIDHLNLRAGTRFRAKTAANRAGIQARLAEGFTLEECIRVVDVKVSEWRGTEYEKYLTPETLFRPSKFEKYLNQKPVRRELTKEEIVDGLLSLPPLQRAS